MGKARLTHADYSVNWPKELRKLVKNNPDDNLSKPILFKINKKSDEGNFLDFARKHPELEVVDSYDEQLADLLLSRNAQLYKANFSVQKNSIADMIKEHYGESSPWRKGTWVYYPWRRQLAHVLAKKEFYQLRTLRNSVLISETEQQKYASFRIGCAGMSVGSNGAIALVLTGGSEKIKIADSAVLSGSNLNRVRTSVTSVGLPKTIITAREAYELNPYLDVRTFSNIKKDNIKQFFEEPWQLDTVIDEIDTLEIKVLLRLEAKKRQLPILMVTEPGDRMILDVERFDLEPNRPIFHGMVTGIEEVLSKKNLTQAEKVKYMIKIIGAKDLPLRDQKAMFKVGFEIPSPPQIGSTAMMSGGLLAYAARMIATGQPLKSGRYIIDLSDMTNVNKHVQGYKKEHSKHTKVVLRLIKSL